MIVFRPCRHYNRSATAGKSIAVLAVALLLCMDGACAGSELTIDSGPGRAGSIAWQSLSLNYAPATDARAGSWRLETTGLAHDEIGALGRIEIACNQGHFTGDGPGCSAGHLSWTDGPLFASLEADLEIRPDPEQLAVWVVAEGMEFRLGLPRDDKPLSLMADFQPGAFDLAHVPAPIVEGLGLREVTGQVGGWLEYDGNRMTLALRLDDGGFDSVDGVLAGEGVALEANGWLLPEVDGWLFSVELVQHSGELLLGSIYLPSPGGPMEVSAAGRFRPDQALVVDDFHLHDSGALTLAGGFEMIATADGWVPERIELERVELHLPDGHVRWLDGPLAGRGLGGLETAGHVQGHLQWHGAQLTGLNATATGVVVDDPRQRFFIDGLNVQARIDGADLTAQADWAGLTLFNLPFGASVLRIAGDENQIRIEQPLTLPLLDGGVVLESLVWQRGDAETRELGLDARIDPVDLLALTRLLGFPEFGGTLSGRFPGVVYADERLSFTGDIDIQAFSGRIRLADLAVERPFGSLPALAAQVEIERLDLAEVTGTFNIGRMEGQMSGWMRDLRLLDWRPVAMDARVFTHEDVRRRRISQRAVENLSSLGGAGGALITGTVLRIFDDFPYRRAGLACRLSNNICHIDGVAPHESGGFYIVEGRALPRLDIIGHRRLVDWPQLTTQLAAMMEERQAVVGEP